MTEGRSVYFQLHERLRHAILQRLRWRSLRPVQEQTIRAMKAGSNVIALAPTAGGKTEAAMFGVLDAMLSKRSAGVRALYLSPLKALLNNQESRITELARMVGYTAFKWHGDVSASEKARFAKDPAPILMTTPESLQVILMSSRYDARALFQTLDFVVIDEIHGFAGDDRGDHLMVLLEQLQSVSADFQRIGLSATVGNPEELLHWLTGSSTRSGVVVNPQTSPQEKLIQVVPLPAEVDPAPTAAVLARGKKSLIFADSRSRVEEIKLGLERSGIRAFPHHGSLSQELREKSEEAFRHGRNCSIVSTSTLELGLDVGDLDHVLQIEAPSTVSAFLQRLGRSGRRKGARARMTFLCRKPEGFLLACALISLAMKRWIEPVEVSSASYTMYVHYVLTKVIAGGGARYGSLIEGEGSPYPFRDITLLEKEQILAEMLSQRVLETVNSLLVIGPEGEKRFGRSNFMSLYAAFETPPLLSVRTGSNQEIGQLESWFVLASQASACFVLGGRYWKTLRVDWHRGILVVEPAPKGAPPTWMGEPALLSRAVCAEIRAVLKATDQPPYLGERGLKKLGSLRAEWAGSVEGPAFVSQPTRGGVRLHTFSGGKINNVIARYHQHRTGEECTPDNFGVSISGDLELVSESLTALGALSSEDTGLQDMLGRFEESRLSKFQSCLPKGLEARFLSTRLLDIRGAVEVCRSHSEQALSGLKSRVVKQEADLLSTDDPFLEQLCFLATSEVTTTKWVFVPNQRVKHTLSERLLLLGCSWVNFRFVTPFELALDYVGPELLFAGVEPKPDGLGPALVHELLSRLGGETVGHFFEMRHQVELLQALWAVLWELRLSGVSSSAMEIGPLSYLLRAYEEKLRENGLADRARVFTEAIATEGSPTNTDDILLEAPLSIWEPLERDWLNSLAGRRLKAKVRFGEWSRRGRLLSGPREPVSARPASCDRHLLRVLAQPETKSQAQGDGTLNVFYAGRRDAEIREVFRRLYARGVALDQVEIVVTSQSDQAIVRDLCAQLDIGCTFGRGVPVLQTRTGQAVTGFLDFLRHGCSAFHLRQLLLGEFLKIEQLGSVRAAQLLERCRVTRGMQEMLNGLERGRSEAEARGFVDLAEQYQHLQKWLSRLSEKTVGLDESLALSSLVSSVVWFLGLLRLSRDPIEQTAARVVERRLNDLASLKELKMSLDAASRLLSGFLASLNCGTDRARPGKLHVSQLSELASVGRRHTFIVGLEEGALDVTVYEDPILRDEQRDKLHPGLKLSTDKVQDLRLQLLERLSALDGEVTFSFASRDMNTGEQLPPNWLFFAVARLLHPEICDLESLYVALGDPYGIIPVENADALTDTDWWLHGIDPRSRESSRLVYDGFPWLQRGEQAVQKRAESEFSAFEGFVPKLGVQLLPTLENPVSVSQLQELATCAFRVFLKRGLGVQAPQLSRPDGGLWLDAATRGSVLHDVFAEYHRLLRREGRSPNLDLDQARLEALLETQLAEVRSANPPFSDYVEGLERQRLVADITSFLRLEASFDDRTPVGLEVGFGLSDSEPEKLASANPVKLDFGQAGQVWLRGRIDRIDSVAGGYEVIDYKTGGRLSRARGLTYDRGKLIQHALYAMVTEQLLAGEPVVNTSYYFPSLGSERAWLRFGPPATEEISALMSHLLEPLRSGTFPQTTDCKVCQYCDYRSACLQRNVTTLKETLSVSPQLEWRRRLEEFR